ncbi:uncharacterized protein [Struthio camelus]|uniref:uncharacterized protein n=1 Tax=Struthio camelus TaxID=8801 RepID=UPI003603D93C
MLFLVATPALGSFESSTQGEICAGFHKTFSAAVKALCKVHGKRQLFSLRKGKDELITLIPTALYHPGTLEKHRSNNDEPQASAVAQTHGEGSCLTSSFLLVLKCNSCLQVLSRLALGAGEACVDTGLLVYLLVLTSEGIWSRLTSREEEVTGGKKTVFEAFTGSLGVLLSFQKVAVSPKCQQGILVTCTAPDGSEGSPVQSLKIMVHSRYLKWGTLILSLLFEDINWRGEDLKPENLPQHQDERTIHPGIVPQVRRGKSANSSLSAFLPGWAISGSV